MCTEQQARKRSMGKNETAPVTIFSFWETDPKFRVWGGTSATGGYYTIW